MKRSELTTQQIQQREMVESAEGMRYIRTIQLRQARKIAQQMKTTPPEGQSTLEDRISAIQDSFINTFDKVSRSAQKPSVGPEAPVDVESVMEDLMKGSRKV